MSWNLFKLTGPALYCFNSSLRKWVLAVSYHLCPCWLSLLLTFAECVWLISIILFLAYWSSILSFVPLALCNPWSLALLAVLTFTECMWLMSILLFLAYWSSITSIASGNFGNPWSLTHSWLCRRCAAIFTFQTYWLSSPWLCRKCVCLTPILNLLITPLYRMSVLLFRLF